MFQGFGFVRVQVLGFRVLCIADLGISGFGGFKGQGFLGLWTVLPKTLNRKPLKAMSPKPRNPKPLNPDWTVHSRVLSPRPNLPEVRV